MAPADEGEHGELDWGPKDFAAAWGEQRDEQWWGEQPQAEEFGPPRRRSALLRAVALLIALALCLGTVGTWIEIAVSGSGPATLAAAVGSVTPVSPAGATPGVAISIQVANRSGTASDAARCFVAVQEDGRTVARGEVPSLGALDPGQVAATSVEIPLPADATLPGTHDVHVSC
jgi:hypothetical protein